MDFIIGMLGSEAGDQVAGAASGKTKNPADAVSAQQQSEGGGSFQQLMQQVMQANHQMPNLAQQAMQQAQQQTRPGGWGQLLQ